MLLYTVFQTGSLHAMSTINNASDDQYDIEFLDLCQEDVYSFDPNCIEEEPFIECLYEKNQNAQTDSSWLNFLQKTGERIGIHVFLAYIHINDMCTNYYQKLKNNLKILTQKR